MKKTKEQKFKQIKKARFKKKLAEMIADGYPEVAALEILLMHGYGDVIETDWII